MKDIRELRAKIAAAFDSVAACTLAFCVARDHAAEAAKHFDAVAEDARSIGAPTKAYEDLALEMRKLAAWNGGPAAKDFLDFSEALKR